MKQLLYKTAVFDIYAISGHNLALYLKDGTLFLMFDYHTNLDENVFDCCLKPIAGKDPLLIIGPEAKQHPILSKIINLVDHKESYRYIKNHTFANENNIFKQIFAPYFEDNKTIRRKYADYWDLSSDYRITAYKANTSANFYIFVLYFQLLYLYYSNYLNPINITTSTLELILNLKDINKYLLHGLVNVNPINNEALIALKEEQGQFYQNDKTHWVPFNDYIVAKPVNNEVSNTNSNNFLFSTPDNFIIRWDINDTLPIILQDQDDKVVVNSEYHLTYSVLPHDNNVIKDDTLLQETSFLAMYKKLLESWRSLGYSFKMNMVVNQNSLNIQANNVLYLRLKEDSAGIGIQLVTNITLTKEEQIELYLKTMNQILLTKMQEADSGLDFYNALIIMESFKLVLNEMITDLSFEFRDQYSVTQKTINYSYNDIKAFQNKLQKNLLNEICKTCDHLLKHINKVDNNTSTSSTLNTSNSIFNQSVLYQSIQDDNLKQLIINYYTAIKNNWEAHLIPPYFNDGNYKQYYTWVNDLFTPSSELVLLDLDRFKLNEWLKDNVLGSVNPALFNQLDFRQIIKTSDINKITTKNKSNKGSWMKSNKLS